MNRLWTPALAGALLLGGCSSDEGPAVGVEEVVRATVSEVVDAPGTVTARATSTVSAPADGTVAQLMVADGASVEQGAVLLRVDSPAAQERLLQARSAATGANTRVRLPRTDLEPLQDQLDAAAHDAFGAGREAAAALPEGPARSDLLGRVAEAEARYRATAAAARSAVGSVGDGVGDLEDALDAVGSSQRAQAAALVAAAEATVDALVVRAPQPGVVTFGAPGQAGPAAGDELGGLLDSLPPELQGSAQGALGAGARPQTSAQLAVGVPVRAGTGLLTVTDVSGLGVTAEVDETDVLLVRPGIAAGVELDAVPGAAYSATVAAVDVTPTAGTRGGVSYRVRLTLAGGTSADGAPAPAPLPGMSAVVDLRVREAVSAVSVPGSAIVRDGARDTVFVEADGAYRRREVMLGALGQDRVEVTRGLQVGERVVVSGADTLADGQRTDP